MAEKAQAIKHKQQSSTQVRVEEPSLYHVILNNDDYTPMDFVIAVLVQFFDKSYEQARVIMLEIHHRERGVAGCYPKEIAMAKADKVNALATINDFPLNCSVEKV